MFPFTQYWVSLEKRIAAKATCKYVKLANVFIRHANMHCKYIEEAENMLPKPGLM